MMPALLLPLALVAPTSARETTVVVDVIDPARLSPDLVDEALEWAAGISPEDATSVRLDARLPDGTVVPVEELLQAHKPVAPPPQSTGGVAAPKGPAADHPGEGTGALAGKTVYLSQCHGWIWYDSLGRFSTQRGNLYNTVEDFHNPEGADAYLVRYLENAGAHVITMRERDHNPQMAVVDNADAAFSTIGTVSAGGAGWGRGTTWAYGDNPFSAGDTVRLAPGSSASATWSVSVPEDGEYAVYISYSAASDQARDAAVTLEHPGGTIPHTLDQTVHGGTWTYLDTLWLPAGDSLTVTLSGDATAWVSADAVRIGGGTGDVTRNGTTTGRPRWEEGAILYNQWNGAPTSVYDPYGERDGSDPSTRSRFAAWAHPSGEDAVYLSWHSNAGGGTGTSTYTYEGSSGPAVEGSVSLGTLVQDEIVDAVRALWDSDWTDRGHRTAAFSEVSPYHNPEMPAALVELAFHDHPYDVEYLKHPQFRRDASRAMARGIVRYFADRDGTAPQFLPEPPVSAAVTHEDGELVVTWEAGPSGDPFGDAATGYRVYTSHDGRSWDNGVDVAAPPYVLDIAPGEARYVRVSATNTGGESFPTEVLGARKMPGGVPPVLVVSAFDRLDTFLLPLVDVPVLGELKRMVTPSSVNPFDTVARHGRGLDLAGWYFDGTSDEALERIDLSAYRAVVWPAGEESTTDESISSAQQAVLREYVEGGGTLLVSGSEVLWDLDYLGSADDQAFAAEVLGATMAEDDADTYLAVGEPVLDGIVIDFSTDDGAPYDADYPDVLDTSGTVLARYDTGGIAAALSEVGAGAVVHFGFPIETIGDEAVRADVLDLTLRQLVPDWEEPDDIDDPGDTGTPSTDTGSPVTDDDSGAADNDLSNADGPGEAVDLDKVGGCGCATGSPSGATAAMWALVGLLGLARRRQAAGSAQSPKVSTEDSVTTGSGAKQ